MRVRPALALLAVTAVLAGCGSDDEDGAEPATTSGGAASGELSGSVGPGFEISLNGTEGITADQQGQSPADRNTTQDIRRAVVADKSLSTSARCGI